MKSNRTTEWLRALALTVQMLAVVFFLRICPAMGATVTWDGGGNDDKLSNPLNWLSDAIPVIGTDAITFDGLIRLTPNNDFDAGSVLSGINFAGTAGAFTLGGNSINLGGDISDSSSNPQVINTVLVMTASRTITVTPAAASLTLSGVISNSAQSNLTKAGAGTLILGSNNTYTGNTIVDGGTLKYIADNTGVKQIIFGAVAQSANTSAIDLTNSSVTATSLVVQTNSSTPNTIAIGSGKTLNITGAFTVGTNPTSSTAVPTVLNISGAGTLNVTNTSNSNFIVGVGSGDNNFATMNVTMDMSQLANFVYSTGTAGTGSFYVGRGTRPTATLKLANTSNSITAATIEVGNSAQTPGFTGTGNNAGGTSTLSLGAGSNVINVNTITLGNTKGVGVMKFETSTGSVNIGGQNGGKTAITVGRESSGSGSTALNQLLLAGHNATVNGGNVFIGVNAGSTAASNGIATFDTGTLNADNFQIAVHSSGSGSAVGTFLLGASTTVGSTTPIPNPNATGILNVNTTFDLANQTIAGTATGTFGIYGGTANINTDIVDASTLGTHTTTLNLAGGTLDMKGHNIGSAAAPITNLNFTGGTLKNVNSINGTAGLTMSGVGVLTLDGVNNYSGDTIINSGTVALTGAIPATGNVVLNSTGTLSGTGSGTTSGIAGNVTMSAGSNLRPGATSADGSIGKLTMASLTVNGGDLRFDLIDSATSNNDKVVVSGGVNFASNSTISPGTVLGSGTYTILTAGTPITYGSTPIFNSPSGTRATLTPHFNTSSITVDVVGGSKTLTWTGAAPGDGVTWDNLGAGGTKNWKDIANAPESFFALDSLIFGDGPTNRSITLDAVAVPGAVTVNNSSGNDYSITGAGDISGATSLTKSGTGSLTLATNNSYSGATTVTGGTLRLTGTINATSGINISADGTLELPDGASAPLNTIPINNSGTFLLNRSDNVLFVSNVISGAGEVKKIGSGSVTLNGVNTYTGSTTITAGTLIVAGNNSLGAGGAVKISGTGALDLAGNSIANNLNFGTKQFFIEGVGSGTGAIVNTGVAQQNAFQKVTLTNDATIGGTARFDIRNAATLDLAGHTLTKIGTNQFSLVATNVTSGNIVANDGLFSIETSSVVQGSGTITYNSTGAGTTAQFWQTVAANVTRPIVLNGVTVINGGQASGVGSAITLGGSNSFNVSGNNALTLTGNIGETGGPRALVKDGPSTLILSGNNTFTGGVIINAGIVQTNSAGALNSATPNAVNFAPDAAFGTLLRLNGNNVTVSALNTAANPGAPAVENGGAALATLTVNNATASSFVGTLQNGGGTGALALVKSGAGTLSLSGSNTFTGGVTINGGTLKLGSGDALNANAPNSVTFGEAAPAGSALQLNGNSATIAGLISNAIPGAAVVENASTTPATLTVSNSAANIFAGVIRDGAGGGALALSKSGTGSLTLTAAHTYTGDSTVSGGTLVVNGSLLSTGNVSVSTGGTLSGAGDGVITGRVGNVTVSNGATVQPGTSPADGNVGTLTASSLFNSGDLRLDLVSSVMNDKVNVTGTANFSAGATITPTNAVTPVGTYVLLTAGSLTGTAPTLNVPAGTRIVFDLKFGTVVPNAITLNVTGGTKTLTWTGLNSSNWDTTSQNWSDNGGASTNEKFFSLDSVVFPSGIANRDIVLIDVLTPTSVTFNNNASNNYSISGSGAIDGALTTLTKSGDGTLTLLTNNTYAGGTTLNGGMLLVGNGGGLGSIGTGPVTGAGGATLVLNRSDTLAINGSISGAMNLVHAGLGVVQLGAANSYIGTTAVQVGTLKLMVAGALPTGTAVTLGSGANSGILDLNGFDATVSGLTTAGTGTNNFVSNFSGTPAILTFAGGTSLFSGSISNDIALSVTSGSLTLTGPTSYSTTTISSGATLQIGSGDNIAALGTGAVTDNGTLIINRSDLYTAANVISGAGELKQSGAGTLVLTAANTYSGPTTITNGTLKVSTSASLGALPGGAVSVQSGATLDLSGNTTANNLNFGQKQFVIAGTGAGSVGAIFYSGTVNQQNVLQRVSLSDNATINSSARFDIRAGQVSGVNAAALDLAGHTLTKIGAGQFSLVGVDVSDGNIIANQGTFSIETSSVILANANDSTSITYNAGVNAQFFSNTGTVTRRIIINGDGVSMGSASNNNTSPIASPITLNADLTITNLNNTNNTSGLELSGVISNGTAPHGIIKNGPTSLFLKGANTYTGATTINAGTVKVTGSLAGTDVTVNTTANLEIAANGSAIKSLMVNDSASTKITSAAPLGNGTVLKTNALNLAASGSVDLTTNGLVVDYADAGPSPLANIRSAIISGYANGTWTGSGIRTSSFASDSTLAVGYAEASDLLGASGGTFMGQNVDGSAVLIRGTLRGDANLDGAVGFADLVAVAQHYGNNTGGEPWNHGDFNYDGNIDFADLVAVAQNYGASLGNAAALPVAAATGVPEPSTMFVLGSLLGAAILGRHRSK